MNLQIEIVVRTDGVRDAPNREHRGKSILLGVTHADSQAQAHLQTGDADRDGSAASTSGARKPRRYARRDTCRSTKRALHLPSSRWKALGALGVEGRTCLDHMAVRVVGARIKRVDCEEGGFERTPVANRLGDHTGHHFTDGVALQAPAQGSPGNKKEPAGGE